MSLPPGTLLGDFRLIEVIGHGAMGEVHVAEQVSLARRVALKILRSEHASDPEHVERFRREALGSGRLRHAAIVPVIAAGEVDGTLYIAMDLIEGRSLAWVLEELRRRGAPPGPETIAAIVHAGARIAEALHYAHEEGLLHRDVKPSNILVDARGRPYLTDFGLVRGRVDSTVTTTGAVVGTPRYVPPEQLDPSLGPIDGRADVYALGVTLYELVTLAAPFEGEGMAEVLARLREEGPAPAAVRNPGVPPGLSRLLGRALARRPEDRPATARDLANELEAVAAGDLPPVLPEPELARLLSGGSAAAAGHSVRPAGAGSSGSTSHPAGVWARSTPGGAAVVSAVSGLAGILWLLATGPWPLLGGPRTGPADMVVVAYALFFLGFAALPAGFGRGWRRAVALGWKGLLVGLAALVLGMREGSWYAIPAAGVLVALLLVASHVLLDRWLFTGEGGRLLAAVVPFVAGLLISSGLARAPITNGLRFGCGFAALFCGTSAATVLPAFALPMVDARLARAVRRALFVGIPAAVAYFATA